MPAAAEWAGESGVPSSAAAAVRPGRRAKEKAVLLQKRAKVSQQKRPLRCPSVRGRAIQKKAGGPSFDGPPAFFTPIGPDKGTGHTAGAGAAGPALGKKA